MIPVARQPEPPDFDARVRQRGRQWLRQHGHPTSGAIPSGVKLPPYWQDCLDQLHNAYAGVCAYVAVYIERVTGASSADHFVPKSRSIEDAYEWVNYRLACAKMNSRKRDFLDVLDPFDIAVNTFVLNLSDGAIRTGAAAVEEAQATIDRLGLDDPECRRLRTDYFNFYLCGQISGDHLRRRCPFVWSEAQRQGLL